MNNGVFFFLTEAKSELPIPKSSTQNPPPFPRGKTFKPEIERICNSFLASGSNKNHHKLAFRAKFPLS